MSGFFNPASFSDQSLWTVSELTAYIRQLFELDFRLQDVELTGEISNLTRAASGHLYFTLKDSAAQIRCVMWRSQAERLSFRPGEGDAILARGRVSVYEPSGQYQLYVESMRPAGRGDLAAAFERLKEQLASEGLFDSEHKVPIPRLPRKIGIVTSADAAALRDILNVLRRRNPFLSVLIAPTLVQGEQVPAQIVRALQWLDGRDDIDLIIVARGGGSIEDLWAFNDERVARAIFAAVHPVISGVGHETDFTIADFVADLRAPTPSAAAELSTLDLSTVSDHLEQLGAALLAAQTAHLATWRERSRSLNQLLSLLSPRRLLDRGRQQTDNLAARLERAMAEAARDYRGQLAVAEAALAALNPEATLARGFAIIRKPDGSIVRKAADVAAGEVIDVQVSDGRFPARVEP